MFEIDYSTPEKREKLQKHRKYYLDMIKGYGYLNYKDISTNTITAFICLCQNHNIYKDFKINQVNDYYNENEKVFIKRLEEYLKNDVNKHNTAYALKNAVFDCQNTKVYDRVFYYKDFIDDLRKILLLDKNELYYNYFPPTLKSKEAESLYLTEIAMLKDKKSFDMFNFRQQNRKEKILEDRAKTYAYLLEITEHTINNSESEKKPDTEPLRFN